MRIKSVIGVAIIIALPLAGWYFRERIFGLFSAQVLLKMEKDIADQAFLPPPLRRDTGSIGGSLNIRKSISESNRYRAENGLAPLQENKRLNTAAEKKIDDMLAGQYFAHQSPSGQGPADLAQAAGYEYVLVGENLALGNFEDDPDLIKAWMESPGHKANILNNKYSEIGMAVRRGTFQGEDVWLAVQEFGLPASTCPDADRATGILVDSNKKRLANLEIDINAKKSELDKMSNDDPNYNAKAGVYNSLVREYNELVDRTKKLTNDYNASIEKHNGCLDKASH